MEQEFQIKEFEDVRSFHVKSFLSMMDDKERKARYINDLLKVFKTFFNYLKKEGHIKERPTANVKNMKQPKVKIITFTESEIRKLLNHFSGRTFLSIRNRAILAMFFDTGMRLTEVTKARKLGVNTIQGYMRMLHYLMNYLDKDYGIRGLVTSQDSDNIKAIVDAINSSGVANLMNSKYHCADYKAFRDNEKLIAIRAFDEGKAVFTHLKKSHQILPP
jgi:site-specific recombinase XerD